MDHYVELRIAPDPEFASAQLMSALFSKLHRALVALKRQDIGVSFPEHRHGRYVSVHHRAAYTEQAVREAPHLRTLGEVMRLHGTREALESLMDTAWLKGMRDHLVIHACHPVPDEVSYRTVQRRQFKTNVERLRRRRAKRHNETLAQAREVIPDSAARDVDLPYVQVSSRSTQQRFCLFIVHGDEQEMPTVGTFNAYGLSGVATIPWF